MSKLLTLHFNRKNYQLIPPETLNVLQTLLTITELTQIEIFALEALIPGGATIV